jgi:hypothetical protein
MSQVNLKPTHITFSTRVVTSTSATEGVESRIFFFFYDFIETDVEGKKCKTRPRQMKGLKPIETAVTW